MSKSIVFLLHHRDHPKELTEHRLLTLYHLGHEALPEDVLLPGPVSSQWLGESTLREVGQIDNNTVLAFLMGARQDALLLLPEKPFRRWQKTLLGKKSSSMVAFALQVAPDSPAATLTWTLGKMGKINLPPSTQPGTHPGAPIKDILMKKEKRIEKSLLHLFQALDAEEAPHKIRVNARTLRSLLAFLKPWADKSLNKELRSLLRDLARDFSDIREQDVLMEQISTFHATHPGKLHHFDALIAHIARERRAHMEDLLRNAIAQNSLGRIPTLVAGLQNLTLKGENFAEEINARYYNHWIAFQVRAATHDYTDVEGTHDLRKEAKAMRYVLENFSPWIPSVDADMASHFKEIQTVLGDLCDARNNQDRLQALGVEETPSWGADRDTLLRHNQSLEEDILTRLGVTPSQSDPLPAHTPPEAPPQPTPEAEEATGTAPKKAPGTGPIPKAPAYSPAPPLWRSPLPLEEIDKARKEY